MGEIADLYVMLRANTKDFTASLSKAAGESEMAGERIRRGLHGGVIATAALGTAVAAAAVTVGVKSLEMATKFQAATERIRTQAGATQGEVERMRKAIYSMAGQVGYGPEQLAEAFYHVESAGYRGAKAVDAVRYSAELAQIGGANLEDTTNVLVGLLQNGIPNGAESATRGMTKMQAYAGVVNAIVGAGNMKMQDLIGALSTGIAGAAKVFGMSLASIGAPLAVLTDEGVPAQNAATRLRMSLSLLGAPAKQSGKYLKELGLSSADAKQRISSMQQMLEKAGVTTSTLASDLRKPNGFLVALEDLKAHMTRGGLSSYEQSAFISRTFGGGRSGAAIMQLFTNLDLLKSKFKQIQDGAGNFSKDWSATQDTLRQQIAETKARVESWFTQLGMALLPMATKALKDLNDAFNWLGKHQDVTRAIVGGFAALALAGLGLAAAWAIANIEFLAIPAAIFAVGAGVTYLYEHCKTFRTIVQDVGTVLKNVLGAAFTWLGKTVLPALKAAAVAVFGWFTSDGLPALKVAWQDTFQAASDVVHWFIDNPIQFVKDQIKLFQDFWSQHGQQMDQIFSNAWNNISDDLKATFQVIQAIFQDVLPVLEGMWQAAWDLFVGTLKTAYTVITDTIHTLWQVFLDTLAIFADLFTGQWGKLWSDSTQLVSDAFRGIAKIFSDFTSGASTTLLQAGKDLIQGLINGIKSAAGQVGSLIKSVGSDIVNGIKSFFGIHSPSTVMAEIGGHLMTGLAKGIMTSAVDIPHILGGVFGKAGGGISRAFSLLKGAGSSLLKDVFGGALGGVKDVGSFIAHLFGGGGGGGAQQWASTISQALSMAGAPGSWEPAIEQIIAHESGGNPNAINLSDSNAAAGDPSRGLMQTIMSTFQAYAGPLAGMGIYNPLANIYAGVKYIMSRYGSVWNVPGILSLAHGGAYVGYNSGGLVPGTGNTDSVPALLTPGEYVLTKAQTAVMMSSKGGWKEYWEHHKHHKHETTHHKHTHTHKTQHHKHEHVHHHKVHHTTHHRTHHPRPSYKSVHEFYDHLLSEVTGLEHTNEHSESGLSKYIRQHSKKHYSAAAHNRALNMYRELVSSEDATLGRALADQRRIGPHSTAAERKRAAAEVTKARENLDKLSTLLQHINDMQTELQPGRKRVLAHHAAHLGAAEELPTYLAAYEAAGMITVHHPLGSRHSFRRVLGPRMYDTPIGWARPGGFGGGMTTGPIEVHVILDGREIAHSVRQHAVRHESRNVSNGLSRYASR